MTSAWRCRATQPGSPSSNAIRRCGYVAARRSSENAARLEGPRRLVGHPEPDRRRLHQLRGRARDLAEDLIEVERRRDDARQPGEPLEPREPPVGRGLLLAQPGELDLRRLAAQPAHSGSGRLRTLAPCIRSAGTGTASASSLARAQAAQQ